MIRKLPAFFFLLIFLGTGFSACKKNKKDRDRFSDEEEVAESQVLIDTLQYKPLSGMNITRLRLDTSHIRPRGTWGVMLRMKVDFQDSSAFVKLRERGFDGYLVDMYVVPQGTKADRKFTELLKEKFLKSFLKDGNRDIKYIADAESFRYRRKFSFSSLGLPAGRHNLNFKIAFLPVKFKPDEQLNKFVRVDRIEKKPDFVYNGKFQCTTPPLKKVRVKVTKILFDKEKGKAKDSDFTLLKIGSGYPDLYWKILAGRETVFKAQRDKNSLDYKGDLTSKAFYCTEKDMLTFAVFDHDVSVFNRDDLLLRKKGKLADFSHDANNPDIFSSKKIKTAEVVFEVIQ
ncbi:hypothetical protein BKI52_19655 [marine bacterium AO1-C]|nr:hypothetical protein BKI52_19655 [marine bacterium AO1-C]